jgi:DNA-binding PadR family transcriptional regulator
MNPQTRELLRLALLRVLEANSTRYGLGLEALRHLTTPFGFYLPEPELVEAEIRYFEDKGFATQIAKPISPENRAWRITAGGRDYLASLSPG